MSDHQVIYSMSRVGKIHPPNKQVLRDITLGFFRGAKIGVLGLNGAGKSTLLRIMAGQDEDFVGETTLSPGITRGFLPQEPQLDPEKTVRQVVVEAAGPVAAALEEYNQIGDRFADPMEADEMDRLISRQAELQELIDRENAWDLDSRLELAMDALRCPPPEASIAILSGGEKRRVAL
ncbi:MAG TPA: ATP-binding cassette domain-containing protein, partial [Anaerolineae bacterium]|nr:ATP-binding cassette domain-containing protein [Anaerolineae bacterium]